MNCNWASCARPATARATENHHTKSPRGTAMIETPGFLSGTPPGGSLSGSTGLADLLSDILRAVHLSGVVLFRAEFHEPWSVATPDSCQLARSLPFRTERIIQFHIV